MTEAAIAAAVYAAVLLWLPSRPRLPPVARLGTVVPSSRPAPWHRRRAAVAGARATLEICELLTAELMAGRPPGDALHLASRQWPALAPVSEAFDLGADVPTALRSVADSVPGAGDLRVVAAAWQVADRSGQGLARALERVSRGIRSRRRTRRVVESELASARATARLVAVLPVAVLTMGSSTGGDPWGFLLTTPVGWACLASGCLLTAGGLLWIERIADRVVPP